MEEEIIFDQSIENIKEYHRVGNSIDGIDLFVTYKDGITQRFHSYNHMFQQTIDKIKEEWKKS